MKILPWALLVACRADADGVSLLRKTEPQHFTLVQTFGAVKLTQNAPMMSLDTACKHHPGAVFDLYLYEKGGASLQVNSTWCNSQTWCAKQCYGDMEAGTWTATSWS